MRYLLLSLWICLALLLSGCSNQPTDPEATPSDPAADSQLAEEVRKLIEANVPSDDVMPSFEELSYLDPPPAELIGNCDIYSVTFLWGDLFNAGSANSETTDWTGTLEVNADAVVHVRCMIDFEPGQDSVLAHNNPTFAAWISYTYNDFDGLSFLIFLPRDYVYITPPVLTFRTAPITLTFTFPELVKLDAFYQVDERNGVIIHSRKIWQNICPGGRMDGTWAKDSFDPNQGTIFGTWYDYWDNPVGLMSGIFWMDDDGHRVFSGSLSGVVTDQVIAEFKGFWWFDDPTLCPVCGDDHGFFMGRYTYLDGSRSGKLGGEFGYGLSPTDIELPLYGIWRDDCPYVSHNDYQIVIR